MTLPVEKSEILFLYEGTYNSPNGDPFTGEPRFDEETKKTLVSDVRIKRYIRDWFLEQNLLLPAEKQYDVYVTNNPETRKEKGESGAAARIKQLKAKYNTEKNAEKIMQKCIDVRLFGGISTEKGDTANLTGPVQFALLNPSLNQVELRIHQNTSVFVSDTDKSQGAIGTTSLVPYSLIQIHGWINPYSAVKTALTQDDINLMFTSLWSSVNNVNTRSKANHNALLLLQIVYSNPIDKLYGLDRMIKLRPKDQKEGEQIRNRVDYDLDFSLLIEATESEVVKEVRFYTKDKELLEKLKGESKFSELKLQ